MFYALVNKDGARVITPSEERSVLFTKRLKAEEVGVFNSREEAEAFLGLKPTPTTLKACEAEIQLPVLSLYYYCEPIPHQAQEIKYGGLIVQHDTVIRELSGEFEGNTTSKMTLLGFAYVLATIREPSWLKIYPLSNSFAVTFKTYILDGNCNSINNSPDQEWRVIELLRVLLQPHKVEVRELRNPDARYARRAFFLTQDLEEAEC